jgi:hypothetical protein
VDDFSKAPTMLDKTDLQTREIWALQDVARHQRCSFLSYNKVARMSVYDWRSNMGSRYRLFSSCAFEAEKEFVRTALTLRLMKQGWTYEYAICIVAAKWSETFPALQELTGIAVIDAEGNYDEQLAAKAAMMLENLSLN